MTIPGVAYARVSTKMQATQGYSLAQQLESCEHYAATHDILLIDVFTDTLTGRTTMRPGLAAALALITGGDAAAFIVFAPDRLSRDRLDFTLLHRQVEAAGGTIHYAGWGDAATQDALEPLTAAQEVLLAEHEVAQTLERTLRGKRGKAAAGKYLGIGPAPYGYVRIGAREAVALATAPQEATVVRDIYTWYLSGMGVAAIVDRLHAEGIDSPGERLGRTKLRGRSQWNMSTVYCMLQNSTYMGTAYAFRYHCPLGHWPRKRPPDEWLPTTVPAIVDEATWDAVQQKLAAGRRLPTGTTAYEFLLKSHVTCGCGYHLQGRTRINPQGRRYHYYICNGRGNRGGFRRCYLRNIPAQQLDALVWDWLISTLDASDIAAALGRRKTWEQEQNVAVHDARRQLLAERAAVERQLERARTAYLAEVFTLEEYRVQKCALEGELHRIDERDRSLEVRLVASATDAAVGVVTAAIAALRGSAEPVPFAIKHSLIELLDVLAEVSEDMGEITVKVTSALCEELLPFDPWTASQQENRL